MSMTEKVGNTNTLYLSIIGGHLMEKTEEGAEGAKKRDYEIGIGADKKVGTKWEIQHKNLTGFITGLEFKDGTYGEQFILTLTSGSDVAQVTIPTKNSRYFPGFAKLLPNVNLEGEVTINPYNFKDTKGKQFTGVSVKQNGEKIKGYYWDGTKSINGIPEKEDDDDWEDYFKKETKFLKKEVEKVELPEIKEVVKEEEISVEDIPF